MIISNNPRVLLSFLMAAGSYFTTPVVAFTAFESYAKLKEQVNNYCDGTFDPDGSHGYG